MVAHSGDSAKHEARPGACKFYKIGPDFGLDGPAGFEIENLAKLLQGRPVFGPAPDRRGFPDYPEPPHVVIDEKFGRPPLDLEECYGYWLISARAKSVFETIDAAGFAFVRCVTRPEYWLCDAVRILDAVDERASRIEIEHRGGVKSYDLTRGASLVFREEILNSVHVFRLAYLQPLVVCDQRLKEACDAAGLKGIKFRDMSDY